MTIQPFIEKIRCACKCALAILCCLLFMCNALAQTEYEPPRLTCVRNIVPPAGTATELNWALPLTPNPCFTGYEIYASTGSRSGPYTLLTTINNPAASAIQFAPPTVPTYSGTASSITYFYIINRGNCNNPAPPARKTSDTLSNEKPQPYVVIRNATVINNQVQLNWYPSPSPEVTAYLILSDRDGFNSFDTVFGRLNTTYTDTKSDPGAVPVRYKVRALEYCESPLGLQGAATPDTSDHTTAFLRDIKHQDIDSCNRTVLIRWDPYDVGSAEVVSYEVQKSVNGAPFTTEGTVTNTTTPPPFFFTLSNIPYLDTVTVRIAAYLPNGSVSYSNERKFSANSIQPPVNDYLRNITVEGNNVIVEYRKDTLASPDTTRILYRSGDGIVYTALNLRPDVSTRYIYLFTDENEGVNDNVYYYNLHLRDQCFQEHITDTAVTLHLGVKTKSNNRADVVWSGFDISNITFQHYRLEKITGGDTIAVGTFSRSEDKYLEQQLFDYAADSLQDVCYRITAVFTNNNDPSPQAVIESHSNTVCVQPEPQAFVPQAFVPNGTNNTFRPFLLYAKAENYDFKIFDRWFRLVYSTQDINARWDGMYNDKPAPLDGYIYIIRFTGKNNKEYTQTGTIMLLR
jgi:gliding motility-associated-like protein